MHLSFAISLFFVAGIAELLRQGGLDLPPLMTLSAISGVMALAAVVLIGRDADRLIRPGDARLYGIEGLGWSWRSTAALLPLIPFLVLIPATFVASFTEFVFVGQDAGSLAFALLVQILVIAIAQELFFREAILKIFGALLPVAFAVSAGATLLFHLVHGLPAAVIAAGASVAYMALRVAGMNILVVAAVHGATTVLFGRILVAQIEVTDIWPYAAAVAGGHAVFAAAVLVLRRAPAYPAGLRRTG